jgi:hypothetical protein
MQSQLAAASLYLSPCVNTSEGHAKIPVGGRIRPGLRGKTQEIPDHSKLPLHIYRTNFEAFQQYLGSEMINLDPDSTFRDLRYLSGHSGSEP